MPEACCWHDERIECDMRKSSACAKQARATLR